MPPESCPNCGADVPSKALCCPECGADEKTGWSEAAQEARLGISNDFDYEEFVEEEFGSKPKVKPPGVSWFWWVVATLLLLAFVWAYLRPLL